MGSVRIDITIDEKKIIFGNTSLELFFTLSFYEKFYMVLQTEKTPAIYSNF